MTGTSDTTFSAGDHGRATAVIDSASRLDAYAVDARRLSIEIAHGPDAADALGARWDDLVLRQRLPNPTLSSVWLRRFLAIERGTPCIVTAAADNRLVAAGAFAVHRPLGTAGPRVARWLGPGRLLNHPDLIVDQAADGSRAGEALLGALLDRVHALYLGKAPLEGAAAQALLALTPWRKERRSADGWVVALPPPSIAHLARKARWAERRAERLGAAASVTVSRAPGEIGPALERLFALYLDRWSGRPGEIDRFGKRDAQRAWYRQVLNETAEADGVRIVEVYEGDLLVASLLGLLAGRGAMFHSTATKPGPRLWGPGHLAMLAWAEEARRSGATIMDLGRGSAETGSPKARLRPSPVPFGMILASSSKRLQPGVAAACDTATWLRDAPRRLRRTTAGHQWST